VSVLPLEMDAYGAMQQGSYFKFNTLNPGTIMHIFFRVKLRGAR